MRYLTDTSRIALCSGERSLTHHELIHSAQSYSRICGSGRGERVCIFAENSPEWVMAFYGAWYNHSIAVPVDVQSTPEEIAFILDDCRPAVAWCSSRSRSNFEAALKLSECQPRVYELGCDIPEVPHGELDFGDNPDEDDAVIIYTSGTTGRPKGVVLTFGNLDANLDAVSNGVPIYNSEDRLLVLLPLHHILPLQGTLVMPLQLNGMCVFAEALSSEAILSALQRHKVTMVVGVPRLFMLLRDGIMNKIRASFVARLLFGLCSLIGSLSFSRVIFKQVQQRFGGALRYLPCGGAALDPQVVKDFRTLGFEILMGYGMSETAPMISFTHPGKPRAGSSGQVIPCNEVRIQDGEITVRGANVMKGYYGRPDETAAIVDSEGWLHTGDLGHVDKDGYIYITGRKKEIIVLSNGKNINPEEIEKHLLEHAEGLITECAVIPSGDALQAVIMPDLAELSRRRIVNIEGAIMDMVIAPYNERCASYKRILKCALVSAPLPRTRLGKLKRHELAEVASGALKHNNEVAAEPAPDTVEYKVIYEYLKDATGLDIYPDDHFELDLSLDSLGKVEFISYLSVTFGTPCPENLLFEHPTPRRLAEYLHSQNSSGTPLKQHLIKWADLLKEKIHATIPRSGFTHRWMNAFSNIFLRSFCRLKGKGYHHLPAQPFIMAPNHQSYLDVLYLMAYMDSATLKNTYFYASAKHIESRIAKFFAKRHNVIIVDVNCDLKLSVQTLAAALKQGHNVVIFPEGTRSIDGSLGKLKQTFAILSRELNVPVVPVAIDGAYSVLPRGRKFPRLFRKVKVTFMKAIYPAESDSYETITDKVRTALAGVLEKSGDAAGAAESTRS